MFSRTLEINMKLGFLAEACFEQETSNLTNPYVASEMGTTVGAVTVVKLKESAGQENREQRTARR